jgi:hypothetical protein
MWSSIVSTVANAGVAAVDGLYKLKTQTAAIELGKQQLGFQYQIETAKMTQDLLKTQQTLQTEQLKNAAAQQALTQQKITFDATQNGNREALKIQLAAMEVSNLFGSAATPAQFEAAYLKYNDLTSNIRNTFDTYQKNGAPLAMPESTMTSLTALRSLAEQRGQVADVPIFGTESRNMIAISETTNRAFNNPGSVSVRDYQDLLLMASRGSSSAQDALKVVNSEMVLVESGEVKSNMSATNAKLLRRTQDLYTIFQRFGGDKTQFDAWKTQMIQRYGTVSLDELDAQIHAAAVGTQAKSNAEVGPVPGTTAGQLENPNAAKDIAVLTAKAAGEVARGQTSAVLGMDLTPDEIAMHQGTAAHISKYVTRDLNKIVMGESQAERDAAAARITTAGAEKVPGMSYYRAESSIIPLKMGAYKALPGAVPLMLPPDRALGIQFPVLAQYTVAGGGSMVAALQKFVNSNESALAGKSAAARVKLFVETGVRNGTLTRNETLGGGSLAYIPPTQNTTSAVVQPTGQPGTPAKSAR